MLFGRPSITRAHEHHRIHGTLPPKSSIPPFLIELAVLAVLCTIFGVLVYRHASHASATYDETTHLPSGYSYLKWDDYRMNPEHPPLVKKMAAWPLLVFFRPWPPNADLTARDQPGAVPSNLLQVKRAWALALVDPNWAQWLFGHSMLYSVREETMRRVNVTEPLDVPPDAALYPNDFLNDADAMLLWGRMLGIFPLGLLLAILVFYWARDLFGLAGGVLALTLFCFDPNFIAHSGLVTTDVGVTAFMFGAVYFLWRTCRRLEILSAVVMALFFSLAFVTKFSAVLLIPMFVLVGLGRVFSSKDWLVGTKYRLTTRVQKALVLSGLLVVCMATAWLMVWAMYSFRYSAFANAKQSAEAVGNFVPPEMRGDRDLTTLPIPSVVRRAAAVRSLLEQNPQNMTEPQVQRAMSSAPVSMSGKLVLFAQRNKLLPEAYLYGFAYAEMKSIMRSSFLGGEYSDRGFWYYFPMTFLLKTPLLTIAAIVLALFFALYRRVPWRSRLAFFIVPVGLYMLVSMSSGLNIGHRHLLPIYPFLFVMCGVLTVEWVKWRLGKREITAALALGGVVLNSFVVFAPPWKPAVVYPNYLAYFNELAGGPRNGYKWLVDSNLDWGQDLKGLKEWLDMRQITEPINLCYFGMADPRFYQIPHVNMPGGYPFEMVTPPGGQQVTREERFYKNANGSIGISNARVPGYLAISATHLQGVYLNPQGRQLWKDFLKNATLVDTIGYSIFIYRLEAPTR